MAPLAGSGGRQQKYLGIQATDSLIETCERSEGSDRAATRNFGDTLDTLVPLTARHCSLVNKRNFHAQDFERPKNPAWGDSSLSNPIKLLKFIMEIAQVNEISISKERDYVLAKQS